MPAKTQLPSGLVTFLFTDIEGSTRMARILGPRYRPVLSEHRRLLRAALSACGGIEMFTEGDSCFAAFADAASALGACAAAQRALAGYRWPAPEATPKVRMGLHTGPAVPLAGEYASLEVHRAARIADAAHGGQVLFSSATARHAAPLPAGVDSLDLGLHRLRGFDDPERLFQLVAPGLERRFPRPRTAGPVPHNLPTVLTSFVGRDSERAELAGLVAEHRMVTVVGPGGVGKSRLALDVVGRMVQSCHDGVWFVDVATVTDPGLVAVAIAAVLGLRPEPGRPIADTLAEYVAPRRILLLLDTCDAQPAASAELVARLLGEGCGVRVFATSREPLGLPGEVVWRIPPLSVEPPADGGPSDATALLLDRTTAARGGRPPDLAELADLHRVATRLDGLPLAIELAAARLRLLSAGQLAGRLDNVIGVLDAGNDTCGDVEPPQAGQRRPGQRQSVGDRHSTLQATVSWSYRTLGPRAAGLLRRLAVFSGPVDLDTVEWVLDDDPLDPLAVLVDKSMIQVEQHPSGNTYRMLDPIRAYAAQRLVEAGEERAARDRHVAWALQALRRAHLDAADRPAALSLHALDAMADEVRTALRWTVTGGNVRQGLQLARGLDEWWRERGLAREGRLWLFRLYERMAETGESIPVADLASAYHMHSLQAGTDGEFAEEMRFSQRAEAAARQAGDVGLLARVLAGRGVVLADMGRMEEAERACREVIGWAHRHDVAADALDAVYCLAAVLWRRGALDEAAELLAGTRTLEAAQPVERSQRSVDMLLGMVALSRGDLVAAHDHLMVALRSRITFGFHRRACDTITAIAMRCARGGACVTAARLFGAAETIRLAMRCSPTAFGTFWKRDEVEVRAVLGDATFDAAYREGGELSLDGAAALALAVEHPDLTDGSGRFTVSAQQSPQRAWCRSAAGIRQPIQPAG